MSLISYRNVLYCRVVMMRVFGCSAPGNLRDPSRLGLAIPWSFLASLAPVSYSKLVIDRGSQRTKLSSSAKPSLSRHPARLSPRFRGTLLTTRSLLRLLCAMAYPRERWSSDMSAEDDEVGVMPMRLADIWSFECRQTVDSMSTNVD